MLCIATIWGFAFVAQAEGVTHVDSFTFTAVRFAMGALIIIPVVLFFEKGRVSGAERRKTVIASTVAGCVLFVASTLQQFGIEYTASAGISGFITGLYTVFIPLTCFFLFHQKIGAHVWLGAVCAVVGLFLLCYRIGSGVHFGLGECLLLVGAFFWTAHVLVVDRMGKALRSLHFAWGQFVVCAVLGTVCMLIFEEPVWSGIWDARISLLYCGVLSVGVAYTLQVIAQKRVSPTFAAIVLSTESVFSAVGGALFGIDEISVLGYVGCALIFVGIICSQLEFSKKTK